MASGKVPEFKTLKECLQFLEWLYESKQGKGMQYRVARRLGRLLQKMYITVSQRDIESALSRFLNDVHDFHSKLCKEAAVRNIGPINAVDALEALIHCIPKLLSVIYFLQYHVDKRFEAVGGGKWGSEQIGMISKYVRFGPDFVKQMISTAGPIDKYLIAAADTNTCGVIPGGFDPGELKELGLGGYNQGAFMTGDLGKILDKHANSNNLFRDVFVTSVVSKNVSVETSNVANAIRLVEDFCGIFRDVKNEQDFKNNLQSRNNCIAWLELKNHCIKLKGPHEKIFKNDRFSFTGYAREPQHLNKEKIATKMAKWLKINLEALRRKLEGMNSKLDPNKFSTTYLFPYGFTFNGYSFKTRMNSYKARKADWDSAIEELKRNNDGLHELKRILDGTMCPGKQEMDEQPESEDDTLPEDLEYVDENDKPVAPKTEATKTEAAKPVVTKGEPVEPTDTRAQSSANGHGQDPGKKAEGNQNQGKKAEGAQNQGKKAEGAQNQSKKAEGDQGNGHSVGNTSSSPVTQAAQTQTQTVLTSDPQSPGAPGSSSGPGQGGQADTSDAGRGSGQAAQKGSDDSNTRSSAASPGPGGSSGGGDNQPPGCSGTSVYLGYHGGDVCRPKHTTNRRSLSDGLLKKLNDIMPPNEFTNTPKKAVPPSTSTIPASPPDSVHPPPEPLPQPTGGRNAHGRDYYLPGGGRPEQAEVGIHDYDPMQLVDVDGAAVKDKPDIKQQKLKERRAVFHNTFQISRSLQSQRNSDEEKQQQSVIQQKEEEAKNKWKIQAPEAEKRLKKYYGDVERVHKILEKGRKDGEVRRKQEEAEKLQKQKEIERNRLLKEKEERERQEVEDWRKEQNEFRSQHPIVQVNDAYHYQHPHYHRIPDIESSAVSSYADQGGPMLNGITQHDATPPIQDLTEMVRNQQDSWDKYYDEERLHKTDMQRNAYKELEMFQRNADAKLVAAEGIRAQQLEFEKQLKNDSTIQGRHIPDGTVKFRPPLSVTVDDDIKSTLSSMADVTGTTIPYRNQGRRLPPLPPPLKPTASSHQPAEIHLPVPIKHEDALKIANIIGAPIKYTPKKIPKVEVPVVLRVSHSFMPQFAGESISHTKQFSPPSPIATSKPTVPPLPTKEYAPVTGQFPDELIPSIPDIYGAPINEDRNKIPMAQVQDTLDFKLSLPAEPMGHPIPYDNKDPPVQGPPPKFKPPDVSGSVTSGFISDVESWLKKEVMYNNIKRDLEAHKKAVVNDQERRIKEAQRYGEGFKNMIHMHDDDRNQHLLDDVQESTEALKLPSPRKLQNIVYPNEKPYVAPPVIETLPHGLQSTETTGDVSKTFIDVNDSESLPEVGLSVDILKHPPFQPLNDYDYGPSYRLPPAIGGDKEDANTFDSPRLASERGIPLFANPYVCQNPWSVSPSSTDITPSPLSPPPATDHLPPPKTVREMLCWFVGLSQYGLIGVIGEHYKSILKDINKDTSQPIDAIDVTGDPDQLTASHVTAKLTETCLYSATIIYKIRHNNDFKAFSTFDFKLEYSKFHYSSDPACLLCQLQDYVYACHHQLQFLKSQCKRGKSHGGWKNYEYGSDITSTTSPLHAFLTDSWDSTFKTHPFDPCNLCLKSRVRMGFSDKDLPENKQLGSVISTILTPSCGGEDPLLTLSSYLNCLTRRTPRTTGELVALFHHFGNLVYKALSQSPPISPSLILRLPTH